MSKNYYETLGVDKNATADEIKKAYYKLAHKYHPHKGGAEANEQKMKEVNEAYSVLGNAEKRKQYDQYGSTFDQARQQGGFSGFGGFRDFSDFAEAFSGGGQQGGFSFDMGDIFGDMFGGQSRGRSRRFSGSDIEVTLQLYFKEAIFGTEKEIVIPRENICKICTGSGAEPGSKVETCKTCNGSGQVVKNIGFGIGFPSVCPDCAGEGKKAEKMCKDCHGAGVKKEQTSIKIKIPAGIDNGQTIRITGQGNAGKRNYEPGDLYVRVAVRSEQEFKREGFDIVSQAEISFTQAALGGSIDVLTLDGKVKLKIPEGTQSGKIFLIKSAGVPHLQGKGRGDHRVTVIVKTPTRLSRKQKDLLRQLDEE